MTTLAVPATTSEFATAVLAVAGALGWRVCALPVTPGRQCYRGHAGLPGVILARRGRIVMAVLLTEDAQPSLDQRAWLAAAGRSGYEWRPSNWDEVRHVLR